MAVKSTLFWMAQGLLTVAPFPRFLKLSIWTLRNIYKDDYILAEHMPRIYYYSVKIYPSFWTTMCSQTILLLVSKNSGS